MKQVGDLKDINGVALEESLELWYRDPVECVRELIGNPMFANLLAYAPAHAYRDKEGSVRHIDEMWTADWWWKTQVRN